MAMASRYSLSSNLVVSASPLWQRAPKRDEQGRAYFDSMVLIPNLKQRDESTTEITLHKIRKSLAAYENQLVYVDANTRLGLLWVTIKPIPRLSRMMVDAIRREIPEARVVAGDFNPESFQNRPAQTLLGRLKKRVRDSLRIGQN